MEWYPTPTSVRPKDIISELRPHLPTKYSPLMANGDGLQSVYLAAVPTPMAEVLLSKVGLAGSIHNSLTRDVGGGMPVAALDDVVENAIRNETDIDETERQAIINARRGQGRFRNNLESIEKDCRVTGVTDRRLLRASHIKPWRSCATNHERLDGYNGLLFAPHIDLLFDQGYISFENTGELLLSPRIARDEFARLGLRSEPVTNVGHFQEQRLPYLAHHRDIVFRK